MYKFTKLKDQNNRFDLVDLVLEVDGCTTTDLTEAFFDFMRGCGFQDQSIISGMQDVIDQKSPEENSEEE